MTRVTQAELTAVFAALIEQRRRVGLAVEGWALTRWQADRGEPVSWRIESDGGARSPMGARWRSARELTDAMRFAFYTLSELPDRARTIGTLRDFQAIRADDLVKTDLELTCLICGAHVCDVEPDDKLDVLVGVAEDHTRDHAIIPDAPQGA